MLSQGQGKVGCAESYHTIGAMHAHTSRRNVCIPGAAYRTGVVPHPREMGFLTIFRTTPKKIVELLEHAKQPGVWLTAPMLRLSEALAMSYKGTSCESRIEQSDGNGIKVQMLVTGRGKKPRGAVAKKTAVPVWNSCQSLG